MRHPRPTRNELLLTYMQRNWQNNDGKPKNDNANKSSAID
jgi:hypothetical protein